MKTKKSIFIAIGIISITLTTLLLIDNSQTILYAYYDGGTNAFTINLKDNGEYEIINGSWLTSKDFHGSYTIKDSIVTLDKNNIDHVILTNKLKIGMCYYYRTASQKKVITPCLLQVDENGNRIDTHFTFTIRTDNKQRN